MTKAELTVQLSLTVPQLTTATDYINHQSYFICQHEELHTTILLT